MRSPSGEWTQSTIHCSRLIDGLRAGDPEAWHLLEARYGPLVRAFARRCGLSREHAEDVRQESLLAFLEALRDGKYDASAGTPRAYLFGIAKKAVAKLRAQLHKRTSKGDGPIGQASFLYRLAGDKNQEAEWKRLEQAAIAAQCLREARDHFNPETFMMFYRRVVSAHRASDVAAEAGKTVAAVNMAVHHVRTFLRQIKPMITEAF